jgi:large subunit ribosomal protein L10
MVDRPFQVRLETADTTAARAAADRWQEAGVRFNPRCRARRGSTAPGVAGAAGRPRRRRGARRRSVTENAMALNLEQKKEVVAELADVASKAHSLVVSEYAGLTVAQLTELRVKARQSGVYLRVAKNTLVARAVEGTEFECVKDSLTGPMLYAFSQEDPGAAGRLVRDFAKANDKLKPRLVAVGGKQYPASHVDVLASLPTREQALAMLLGVMKAPIEKFVRTLAEPAAMVARAVAAVRDQKQSA